MLLISIFDFLDLVNFNMEPTIYCNGLIFFHILSIENTIFHILSIENTITINSDKLNIYLYLNLLIVFFPLKTYFCSKMETLNSWHTKTTFIWELLNYLQVIICFSNHSWIHRSTYTLISIDRVRSTYRLLCSSDIPLWSCRNPSILSCPRDVCSSVSR